MKISKFAPFLIAAIVLSTVGCSSSKSLQSTTESVQIKLPFSEKEYKTDKEYIRVVANGESPNLALAEKIATANAQNKMTRLISSVVKNTTENYANQSSDQTNMDFSQNFQVIERTVSNETLTNIKVLDSKVFQKPSKIYDYWVVIEVSRKSLAEGAVNKMSSSKILKLESDQAKFRKIFDEEMSKLNN